MVEEVEVLREVVLDLFGGELCRAVVGVGGDRIGLRVAVEVGEVVCREVVVVVDMLALRVLLAEVEDDPLIVVMTEGKVLVSLVGLCGSVVRVVEVKVSRLTVAVVGLFSYSLRIDLQLK